MNDVLKIFLSMSLSGSLLIIILFAGKHFLKDRVSRQWQYYIWLIVIARLLLPFAPETNLMGTLFQTIDHRIVQSDTVQPSKQNQSNFANIPDTLPVDGEQENVKQAETPPVYQPVNDMITLLVHNIWLVWLTVALILLIQKVTVYKGFVRYVKAGQIPISDTELLDRLAVIGEQAGVKKPVELCLNPLMSSPLLIGFFNPCIVLPSTDISEKDYRYIVLHELTHYRRWDMFYKWLVQVTVCLHWFNPLVYLMSREINKACEFSCDEVIISKSDFNGAQEYGKTLLDAMAKAGSYKESLASVTLNENKEMLKERLGAIMSFKKKSLIVKVFSVVLTLGLCFSTTVLGAYAANSTKGQDIWVVDGEEMDQLPKDLEDELRKDPVVREQLGLDDMENQSNTSSEEKNDIWVVDGEEMDQLPEDLENELSKDPIVREQLGLDNTEEQTSSSLQSKDEHSIANRENSNEKKSLVNHITSFDGTEINSVVISGKNLGIVVEKSSTNNFELDYVGVADINKFSIEYLTDSDGILTITALADSSVNYISTDPDNKVNVVNIKIPEKIYDSVTLNIQRGGLFLPTIRGNVSVDSEKSLIKVVANQFESDLKLNLKKSSLKFNVTGISNNINVIGTDTGNSVNITFNAFPENLKLDATKCKGSVVLPDGWSTDYKIGTNKPIVNLNINGNTTITVK